MVGSDVPLPARKSNILPGGHPVIMRSGRSVRRCWFLVLSGIVLISIISCIAPPVAAVPDGSIRIYSTPPGSDACLDSPDNSGNCQAFDSSGFTEFYNIPGDSSHTVSIFLDGYQTYTISVYVAQDQEVEGTCRPATESFCNNLPRPDPGDHNTAGFPAGPHHRNPEPVLRWQFRQYQWPVSCRNHRKRHFRCRNCDSPSNAHKHGKGAEGDRRLLLSFR